MLQAFDARSPQTMRAHASISALLRSGGDHRIVADPATGRNKYGVPSEPTDQEIWLSSSTASAISRLGFEAAEAAFRKVMAGGTKTGETVEQWFDGLRGRIAALTCCDGTDVVLCASGTETELLALALSRHLLRRPLTNILIAVQESGVGVSHAASGAHFDATTALDGQVCKGEPLLGWEDAEIQVVKVDLRDPAGALRPLAEVDEAVRAEVGRALQAGRDVQLHILDASKTGRGGPSRAAVKAMVAEHPRNIAVVVDACQLRCSFDDIRADLESGFMVMITGSKFAGGPAFCGALLVPPSLVEPLRDLAAPAGLSDYSARMDWPARLRPALSDGDYASFNLGLGLRWEAALAEIEAHVAIAPLRRTAVMRAFQDRVEELVDARPHLHLLDADIEPVRGRVRTIFSIVSGDGAPERVATLHRALRESIDEPDASLNQAVHLGQPVTVAGRAAVRVCISMPTIRSVAERLDRMSFQQAFAPLSEMLETAFRKWDVLENRSGLAPRAGEDGDSLARGEGSAQAPADPPAIFETSHDDPPLNKAQALRLMSSLSGRPPMTLAKELFKLARGNGRLSFRDYVAYRLFDDSFVGDADKTAFVGRRRNQELVAEINYRHEWNCIADDKIATASYLAAYGLPVIPTSGLYAPHIGRSHGSLLKGPSDLRRFLSEPANYPLFGKPVDGLQSLGSIVLKRLNAATGTIETSRSLVSIDRLVATIVDTFPGGYIFQPRLTAHAAVAAVTGGGLSTVRLVTIATDDGPQLFAAAWKLLAGDNVADNFWRAGNILAAIDRASGRVVRATTGTGFDMHEIDRHPTTGAALKDLVLPMLPAVVETAIEGHRALRNIGIIGWDIGVTDQGPVIVEANVTPDLLLVQAANRTGAFDPVMIDLLKRRKLGAKAHYRAMKATLVKD